MVSLITVEGIKVNAKPIPKTHLFSIWKTITNKPFPKVKANELKDNDFDRVIRLRRCKEDDLRELKEWNTLLTTEGTDACVFNADETTGLDFMIIIRKSHYHKLEKILEHELSHITRGDL